MNGPHHSMIGASTGASIAALSGHGIGWVIAGALIAGATSAGPTSPDMDQDHRWQRLDGATPDEALGGGGPLKHRGITHWWALPVVASMILWWSDIRLTVDGAAWPIEGALFLGAVGWASHIVADAVFGQGGVPLVGWFGNVGVELEQDGVLASLAAWMSVVFAIFVVMQSIGIID